MEQLRALMDGISPGKIEDTLELESELAKCWDKLRGEDGGMMGGKLHGRMENVQWNPPFLTFEIERHGGTALGSTRAELQQWTIDVQSEICSFYEAGYHQVRPKQTSLDVKPLADEIAKLVRGKHDNTSLKWYPDGHVRVLIGEILPERFSPKRTREGRHKRFWKELDKLLEPDWERRRHAYYPINPTN